MAYENPYNGFLKRITDNNGLLDKLRQRTSDGEKIKPEQLKDAYGFAHSTVTELASFLGIDKPGGNDEAVDSAGLDVYDKAVDTCINITKFSLDLARLHGPAYLIIPE